VVKRSGRLGRVRVTADGEGVVSHAGAELLRELAGLTGLVDAWDAALIEACMDVKGQFAGCCGQARDEPLRWEGRLLSGRAPAGRGGVVRERPTDRSKADA
jgi:hypothetical protein